MNALAAFAPSTESAADAVRGDARQAPQRIGAVLSAAAVLFLLLDAAMKLLAMPFVLEASAQLGYPASAEFARGLGALLLGCTLLYVWPRTAVVGAILLTGYLGGAIAAHVRVSHPLLSHTLFGVYIALFTWGGLFLRDARVRALFEPQAGAR
jgi:hypothetical protein